MKKLPRLQKKRINAQSLAVVALVALMLAVTYLGTTGAQVASVTLPAERVPVESVPAEATAGPDVGPEDARVSEVEPAPTQTAAPVVAQASSDFDDYRLGLTSMRASAAALLDEVILNAAASADTVEAAIRQKAELARAIEIETTIETLLAARGFEEALCTVRQGSVNVIVRGGQLNQQQAAQILDIAMSESGEPAANVRIIPAE